MCSSNPVAGALWLQVGHQYVSITKKSDCTCKSVLHAQILFRFAILDLRHCITDSFRQRKFTAVLSVAQTHTHTHIFSSVQWWKLFVLIKHLPAWASASNWAITRSGKPDIWIIIIITIWVVLLGALLFHLHCPLSFPPSPWQLQSFFIPLTCSLAHCHSANAVIDERVTQCTVMFGPSAFITLLEFERKMRRHFLLLNYCS